MKRAQNGFSLIEMVVTIGLLSSFLGFITISLLNSQRATNMSVSVETLLSDFRSQQIKAMVGDTEGQSSSNSYGIYFNGSSYVLFRGSSYNASEPSNFTVTLDPQFQFSPSGRTVVFTRVTGTVSGYSSSQNTVTLSDTSNGASQTMTFNQYGIPTNVQ